MKSNSANVHFNENGTPVADHFDDVYFSNDSGINETLHVFINGNDLHERWLAHPRRDFVIAETGFGTGLNCLVAMQAFTEFRRQHPDHVLQYLFILTTEKFPLVGDDIKQSMSAFPSLESETKALLDNYPLHLQGCHRLHFDDFSTVLDIWIGDVHELLPQWHSPSSGLIDAWFLDGFAPSKNPDMWTDALFQQMARLSRPGTTFATFTAAGIVKRGLIGAGFHIVKRKGFGRKRDMLTGSFIGHSSVQNSPPWQRYTHTPVSDTESIAIVGGGLAAATVAFALARQGIASTIFCADEELAQGASGNPQAGFYPQLHAQGSIASQIQAHGFLYAKRLYRQLDKNVAHQWCGVLQLNFSDVVAERQQKMISRQVWPDGLIRPVHKVEAEALAKVPLPFGGLFIAEGGWLSPPQLVKALITAKSQFIDVKLNHSISDVEEMTDSVQFNANGQAMSFSRVILATGADSFNNNILKKNLPLRPVRGQVEAIPAKHRCSGLQTVLCHKGYMTPQYETRQALGSTYGKDDTACDIREEDSATNLATHKKAMAGTDWVESLKHDGQARAAIRLTLPDHQPASGKLHDRQSMEQMYRQLSVGKALSRLPTPPFSRVNVLTGLGSRGLTTAPLMAEILVSELLHQPLPVSETLQQALSPLRFAIRDCIRGHFQYEITE